MWTIQEVKEKARAAFKANYWPCVGIALLMSVLTGGTTFSSGAQGNSSEMQSAIESGQTEVLAGFLIGFAAVSVVSILVKIFIANPVEVGGYRFFKENIEEPGAPFSLIKTGFQNFGHTFATLLLRDLFLILWALLFIIPALIKGYSYCMVPFILAEHPELFATEVIRDDERTQMACVCPGSEFHRMDSPRRGHARTRTHLLDRAVHVQHPRGALPEAQGRAGPRLRDEEGPQDH